MFVMLEQTRIREIAKDVAAANLPSSVVRDILVEPGIGSRGDEILRITMVIVPDGVSRISGDASLDTLVAIQSRLRDAGEERFPIVEYATEEELQESGDP
jgi:hypothetical protein